MIFRSFILGLAMGAMASASAAGTLSQTNYAGWTIGAYSSDDTGAFSYCGASIPYQSGTTLIFALGTGGWMLGLVNPRWQLPTDATYPVTLQIDRNLPISITAKAETPTLALAQLETSAYLFQLFRKGHLLKVQAAGESMGFDLANSGKVLEITLACASARLAGRQTVNQQNNPFTAGSAPPSSAPATSTADHTAETTAFLANVLSAAGIQGFSMSPQTTPDMKPWEVAWTAPHVAGLARIDDGSSVDQSGILIAAIEGSRCKGNFASTKQPSADGKILLLKTACQSAQPGESSQVSFTIAPRPAGGSYITAATETSDKGLQPGPAQEVGPRLLEASHRYLEPATPR